MDTEWGTEMQLAEEPQSWLASMDWIGVRQAVETESRAEVVLLGLGNAGKSTLFNSLRGWPVMLTSLKLGRLARTVEEPMGLFTLIDLPNGGAEDGLLDRLDRAALLIYVLDGAVRCTERDSAPAVVRAEDARWLSLLRATGRPLMVVLNKADLWTGRAEAARAAIEQRVGAEVLPVSAYDPPELQRRFVDRMIETCPDLAVPLAREIAVFRHSLAQRLIRRASLLCGLVAVEPIPLLDLPLQLGAQVGLVARIAAIYGRPPASDYSKELILTATGGVAARLLVQQLAKVIPFLGWAASGLLAAGTTWLFGQAALAYFENGAAPSRIGQALAELWRKRVWSRLHDMGERFAWRRLMARLRQRATPKRVHPQEGRDA